MTCDWLVWDWAWQGTKSKNLRCGLLGPAPEVPAATVHQACIEWATRKAEAFILAARSKHPTHRPQILRDFSQNMSKPFCTRGICPVESSTKTSTPDIRECCLQVFKAAWVPDTSKRLITKRPLFRWTCATAGFLKLKASRPSFGGKSDDYFCSLYEHSFPSRLAQFSTNCEGARLTLTHLSSLCNTICSQSLDCRANTRMSVPFGHLPFTHWREIPRASNHHPQFCPVPTRFCGSFSDVSVSFGMVGSSSRFKRPEYTGLCDFSFWTCLILLI